MFPLFLENFSDNFSLFWVIFYVVLSILNGILLYVSSLKSVLAFQQSNYKYKRYLSWLNNPDTPYLKRLMLLCLLGFLFFLVLNVCFAPVFTSAFGDVGKTVVSYFGLISYFLFTSIYIKSESSINVKVPLKITKRLLRLAITFILFLSLFSFLFITLLNYLAFIINNEIVALLRLSLICAMPILTPYILIISAGVIEPVERAISSYYIKRAKQRLEKSNVLKIAITGSYGKSSVKEILKTLLMQKFRVLSTPASFNTPLGIALTTDKLDSTHDIFIAEMGARQKGDIDTICKIFKPDIGLLTGVNYQHLETFKSIENTMETKFELFNNLSKKGKAFFSSDNENSVKLFNRFKGEKYISGLNETGDNFLSASDITTNSSGTTFTINAKGYRPIKCNTVLLGKHSIMNILLAVSVALKIGLNEEEVERGINRLNFFGHRLELVPTNKDVTIIDDSFNSNEDGINAAIEVLNLFSGRKIVVTPGLVELGKRQNTVNYNFGKLLSINADIVIVVGKTNAEMLINGLLDGGKKKEEVYFSKNLNKGNEILNSILEKGDVVLFENDLPDNYS